MTGPDDDLEEKLKLEHKLKRHWSGYGQVVLIVMAILIGYFVLLPVVERICEVFQTITRALGGK